MKELGKELNQGFIGLALNRRRGESDFQGRPHHSGDCRFTGSGMYPDFQGGSAWGVTYRNHFE